MTGSINGLIKPMVGIVGLDLCDIQNLKQQHWEWVTTPRAERPVGLLFGVLDDAPIIFLPRHNRSHTLAPNDINQRANIDALKRTGVTEIISFTTAGSLQEDLSPGQLIIVDQYIDHSSTHANSFFGPGCVAHVSMANPVCSRLGDRVERAARDLGLPITRGGTYLAIDGPQFSTLAESNLYRSWGCAVIGMTEMPEAKLAREAELCYATVALVTDYDCWHGDHKDVTSERVTNVLHKNIDKIRTLVEAVAPTLSVARGACASGCDRTLDRALVTIPDARDPALMAKLDVVTGRVLRKNARHDRQ